MIPDVIVARTVAGIGGCVGALNSAAGAFAMPHGFADALGCGEGVGAAGVALGPAGATGFLPGRFGRVDVFVAAAFGALVAPTVGIGRGVGLVFFSDRMLTVTTSGLGCTCVYGQRKTTATTRWSSNEIVRARSRNRRDVLI